MKTINANGKIYEIYTDVNELNFDKFYDYNEILAKKISFLEIIKFLFKEGDFNELTEKDFSFKEIKEICEKFTKSFELINLDDVPKKFRGLDVPQDLILCTWGQKIALNNILAKFDEISIKQISFDILKVVFIDGRNISEQNGVEAFKIVNFILKKLKESMS